METVNLGNAGISMGGPAAVAGINCSSRNTNKMSRTYRFIDFLAVSSGEALYYEGILTPAHVGIHETIVKELVAGMECFTSKETDLFLRFIRSDRESFREFEGVSLFLPYGNGELCRRAYYSKKDGWINGDAKDPRDSLIVFRWV